MISLSLSAQVRGLQEGAVPLLRGGQSGRVRRVHAARERPLRRTPLHHREVRVRQMGQDSLHQVLQPTVAAFVTQDQRYPP